MSQSAEKAKRKQVERERESCLCGNTKAGGTIQDEEGKAPI